MDIESCSYDELCEELSRYKEFLTVTPRLGIPESGPLPLRMLPTGNYMIYCLSFEHDGKSIAVEGADQEWVGREMLRRIKAWEDGNL